MSVLLNGTLGHGRNETKKSPKKRMTVEQEMLLKEGTSGKVFAYNYARRWHTLCYVVVDNQKYYCENT